MPSPITPTNPTFDLHALVDAQRQNNPRPPKAEQTDPIIAECYADLECKNPIYEAKNETAEPKTMEKEAIDGAQLYASNCQACHQQNGEGLKGAFPPLKGSKIVVDKNPEILIEIIMKGYDAREEYGAMPAVGLNNGLTAAEIRAIINHERTSWGNQAEMVSLEEVERILTYVKNEKPDL